MVTDGNRLDAAVSSRDAVPTVSRMTSIDEPVHVVDYDTAWPEVFLAERARISTALAIRFEQIEHIGSTAVPGLAGKPIVDSMLGLSAWPPSEFVAEAIRGLNYEPLGEAGVPERLYFRLRGSTSFNLHVVDLGGNRWMANLALRDYLRLNRTARERYAEAKRLAVASGAVTLLAYSRAKEDAMTALLQKALAASDT